MAQELANPTQTSPVQHVDVAATRQAHATELDAITRYRRMTNYIAVAQIYLRENVLLEEL